MSDPEAQNIDLSFLTEASFYYSILNYYTWYQWALIISITLRILYILFRNKGWLPKKSVKGEHVFMTGGGSGIGRKMSIILAKLGAYITIADIDLQAAKNTVDLISKAGFPESALAVECDVTNPNAIKGAAQIAREWKGSPTILFNNAGIVTGKRILNISKGLIEKTLQVNTIAHHYTVQEFLPDMIKAKKGHICTIASVAGFIGIPGLCDYCASKFGAFGFDEALRMELLTAGPKIRTTCVCPYIIETGMFEGTKTKFNFIMPILKEDFAAWRILTAIRQNEIRCIMPYFFTVILLCRFLLPVPIFDWISCTILGGSQSMDNFIGRRKSS